MLNKFLLALCVLSMSFAVQAQAKIKKTVTTTTTTEEVNENGSLYNPNAETHIETNESTSEVDSSLPSHNESWYTLWGVGYATAKYSEEIGDIFETAKNKSGVDRSLPLNWDLLGFYWPLEGHTTMIGVIINGLSDRLTYSGGHSGLTTTLLAFSTHHFFGKNIGDGWFVRGDVGLARAAIDDTGANIDEVSDPVLGVAFGGGYAFPISQETRLLLGLYVRQIPEMEIKGLKVKGSVSSLSVGFLF